MSARPRILLTHTPDARANYYGAQALAGLRILGDVALHEQADPLHGAALIQAAAGCSLVVADRNTAFPAAVLAAMTDTAAVLRCAVDISNIDVTAASANGILVTQAGRSWIASVAELTIGLMIDAARGISRANAAYKSGQTAIAAMGTQLEGSVAGLVGYGPLGRRVGELCRALGMQVLVADPYVTEVDGSVIHVALGDLLRRSDFVLVLAAATPETENLIDAATLGAMKPSAVLINVARGNLVDESALADALDAGRIAGAAMDVGRAADQMPSLGLAHRPDVSATPHIAGLTRPAIEGQALETVRQAAEIVHGRAPRGSVNAEHARRLSRIS
jgi:D-3-phosphoglycerate dehydrogenase